MTTCVARRPARRVLPRPCVSPDGLLIVMLCNYSGYGEVWLMVAGGSRLTQLTYTGQVVEDFA